MLHPQGRRLYNDRLHCESGRREIVLKLRSVAMTDIGRKRERNEDNYFSDDAMGLFVVADGMGGHSGGAFASALAVKTIEEVMRSLLEDPEATVIAGVNETLSEYGLRLKYAITVASERIFDQAIYDVSLRGMGTTTVALLFEDGNVYVANVGDSRAYLLRGTRFEQITDDHSLVGEQLRAGLINKKDVKNHRFKNIITRSVGFQEQVEIDLLERKPEVGDRFLLCTDGLTNYVYDHELKAALTKKADLPAIAQGLIALANERGGDDNITLILVDVLETDG